MSIKGGMSLTQYITPSLTWGAEKYDIKKDEGYTRIKDDEISLRWFRRQIFEKNQNVGTIVMLVYNKNTKSTIDLYLKMKPQFRLIVKTPILLYTVVQTYYEYTATNNSVFHYEITPLLQDLYNEVDRIIDRVYNLIVGNIVVIGSIKKYDDDNVYYINDLQDIPGNVKLVIDTMIDKNDRYITFAESVDRFFSFKNVVYYRLISKDNFKNISMSEPSYDHKIILEYRKHLSDNSNELFGKMRVGVLDYYINKLDEKGDVDKLLDYPLDILPAIFLIKWERKGYKRYPGVLVAVLINNVNYLINMFNLPDKTDDANFDYVNRKRVYDSISKVLGEGGLLLYLNIFNEIFNNIKEVNRWCNDLYINYPNIINISKELEKFNVAFSDINVVDVYKKAVGVLKEVYGDTPLKCKKGIYYDNNSNPYNIDEIYTIQNFKKGLPEEIVPIVVNRTQSKLNIVYLFV